MTTTFPRPTPATDPRSTRSASRSAGARPRTSPAALTLLVATVLTGLSAGFFFTYEASVTVGLAEVDDVTYVETFQAINNTIRNPAFGVVFFGSAVSIAVAAAASWRTSAPATRTLVVAAFGLYVAGLVITMAGNVPLNDELGMVTPTTPTTAAAARMLFEDDWNRLNFIRTVAVVGSFMALAVAMLIDRPQAVATTNHETHATSGHTG